jgi:hypothetical protein
MKRPFIYVFILAGCPSLLLADPPKPTLPAKAIEWRTAVALQRSEVRAKAAEAPALEPGLYASVPYSMIVQVPREVDSKIVVQPSGKAVESTVQPPPNTLVPLRR